mgnify:FL=1
MIEFLSPLFDFVGREQASVKVIVTLLILVSGHLAVKLSQIAARKVWVNGKENITKKQVKDRQEVVKHAGYLVDAGVISLALIYLNNSFTSAFFTELSQFIPNLLSAALVGILGVIAIRLMTKVTENFMKTLGTTSYLREVGFSGSAVKVIATLFKGFLYLVLLQLALAQLGIGNTFVRELVNASSWAAAFLVAGLLFYGFKDLFQNFAAGIYLKNSRFIRPGEEIHIGDEQTEIRDISLFSTSLNTVSGKTVISPNKRVMDSDISFRRTKNDLDTLEEIKNYFVAEKPEYAGLAAVQMGLELFGYRHEKPEMVEKLGEYPENEEMIKAIEELTEDEVKTAFIEEDKITDTAAEFKTWFNDGALIIPKFNKDSLFSDSETSKYALAVGVEGQEILMADPSSKKGGVYYVDREKLRNSMKKLEGEGGYLVLAPEGTTAHWRIKKELLYSDRNYYGELSKTLEARLTKIMRRGRIMEEVMPEAVSQYLEKWQAQGDVTRLWSPIKEE